MSMLNKLVVDVKEAWVSYPGIEGFELKLAYLSRQRMVKLRKDCLITKIDRKTRVPMEVLDEDRFIEEFVKAAIKDWKGLTIGKLEELVPLDLSEATPETEIPFSSDDAFVIVKNSAEFETWLNEVIFDLQNFRSRGD